MTEEDAVATEPVDVEAQPLKGEPPEPKATSTEIALGAQMKVIQVDTETGLAIPKTMEDQVAMAAWAHKSGLLPETIKTTAQAWMVMQRGRELGFPGLTAFEFLYPVNGKVRLTPDGAKAKALESGLLADYREQIVGDGDAMKAVVTIRRKGLSTEIISEFSVQDARLAGLWPGKDSSAWKKYPKRMLLARARGFAFADAFRDVIGGLQVREVNDLDPGESISAEPMGRRATEPPTPPSTPDQLLVELAQSTVEPGMGEPDFSKPPSEQPAPPDPITEAPPPLELQAEVPKQSRKR